MIDLKDPAPIQLLYPNQLNTRRYTNIYFGENQLSPSTLSILLRPTGHPNLLHQIRVRAFPLISAGFTLPMGRSLGFGSTEHNYFAAI